MAARGGETVTAASLKAFFKDAGVRAKDIDDLISTLKDDAKFVLEGTGEFKKVKGHHPLAKKAFDSDKFYNLQKAFSVSITSLNKIKSNTHAKITGQQNSLYTAFAKTGKRLTLKKMSEIEIQAMINAGVPRGTATGWVIKALENLKNQGVKFITNIPWNGINQ